MTDSTNLRGSAHATGRTPRATAAACTLAAILVVIASACGGRPGDAGSVGHPPDQAGTGEAEEPAIAVRTAVVARGAISSFYTTSSTLRADRRATVIARTRGIIRNLEVEEGDRVRAGQLVAVLENDEQRIAVERSRASSGTARREAERLRGLFERGLVSEDEYERTRRDAEDGEHALALAELELERTAIRAPFAGVILERHLDVGATVADGTPIFELADLEPLYADINIPERHVARLRPGQEVRLTADSTETTAEALIERIAPMVDPATGTVKVTVAVSGSAALRPGAFVRVDIVTDTHSDALIVERSALVAEGRRWHLFRLAGESATVAQLEVALGFENGTRVEIAAVLGEGSSLAAGDQVVVVGAPALSDGVKVQVITDEPEAAPASEG